MHTLDVTEQAERIALEEGIDDEETLFLLKTAALYHDTGYLQTYHSHEERSCLMFKEDCDAYLTPRQSEMICEIIMATRMPQRPSGLYQKIICDADMDYIGRDDFFPLANLLRDEFIALGIVKDDIDWQNTQIRFLEDHRFFTEASLLEKESLKQLHLLQLKKKIIE